MNQQSQYPMSIEEIEALRKDMKFLRKLRETADLIKKTEASSDAFLDKRMADFYRMRLTELE